MISNLIDTQLKLFRKKFKSELDCSGYAKMIVEDYDSVEAFLKESMLRVESEVKKEIEKVMDKKRAKKICDNLEAYTGSRSCRMCGYNPEEQRKILLNSFFGRNTNMQQESYEEFIRQEVRKEIINALPKEVPETGNKSQQDQAWGLNYGIRKCKKAITSLSERSTKR